MLERKALPAGITQHNRSHGNITKHLFLFSTCNNKLWMYMNKIKYFFLLDIHKMMNKVTKVEIFNRQMSKQIIKTNTSSSLPVSYIQHGAYWKQWCFHIIEHIVRINSCMKRHNTEDWGALCQFIQINIHRCCFWEYLIFWSVNTFCRFIDWNSK